MKRLISFFVLLLIGFSTNSCAEAEKLLDVPIRFTITEEIPVHINQAVGSQNFQNTVILSIDNSDTHDYLNKIKEVKIYSLKYKLIQFSGDAACSAEADLSMDNILISSFDENVKRVVDAGTVYNVDNVDDLNKIASKLKSGHKVTAKFGGKAVSENASTNFKVKITMDVKVTANPL